MDMSTMISDNAWYACEISCITCKTVSVRLCSVDLTGSEGEDAVAEALPLVEAAEVEEEEELPIVGAAVEEGAAATGGGSAAMVSRNDSR